MTNRCNVVVFDVSNVLFSKFLLTSKMTSAEFYCAEGTSLLRSVQDTLDNVQLRKAIVYSRISNTLII